MGANMSDILEIGHFTMRHANRVLKELASSQLSLPHNIKELKGNKNRIALT